MLLKRLLTVKIASCPTFEAAAEKVVDLWRDADRPNPIRLEGFAGVGKSGLAKLVVKLVGGEHIAGDHFVSKFDAPPSYRECMRQSEFDCAIVQAFASGRVVVLDADCLEEVAPSTKWGRGFVVYIKRLSFNNQDPIWHGGFHLEDEAPAKEVNRSIHMYNKRVKPHETADLIIELPETGHLMPEGRFDRSMCFDPLGAEVIYAA
jgi:hypothetical protein